jgi:hypothetical protein
MEGQVAIGKCVICGVKSIQGTPTPTNGDHQVRP